MDETQVLSQVADTILSKPITFEIDILHPSYLQKIRKKTKRSFKIMPSTLGTMIKISKEFLSVEVGEITNENFFSTNYKLITEHARRMARVVSFAVVNNKDDPPDSLISFFENNLTSKELSNLVNIIINQMDVVNFLKSIISAKGVNILTGVNPQTKRSQVASGVSLEE